MYLAVFHAAPLARGGYISSVEMCVKRGMCVYIH